MQHYLVYSLTYLLLNILKIVINERTNQFSISQETIQVILVFFVKYNLKYILFALKVYYINFY